MPSWPCAPNVERGLGRLELQRLMPPGAARNAIDCALLDLEAKLKGRPAHELLGLPAPKPAATAFTLALGTPEAMAAAARATPWPLYKLKLGGAGDVERVRAVRAAVPDARLVVDANEAWDEAMLRDWLAELAALGVEMVEQPPPRRPRRRLGRRPRRRHPLRRRELPRRREPGPSAAGVPHGQRQARQDGRNHGRARTGPGGPARAGSR